MIDLAKLIHGAADPFEYHGPLPDYPSIHLFIHRLAPIKVTVGLEDYSAEGLGRWFHICVSWDGHSADWDMLNRARKIFVGEDADCVMFLPRAEDYINIKGNALHLYERLDADIIPPFIRKAWEEG